MKNGPLVLPKFKFTGVVPVTIINPVSAVPETLPTFPMTAHDWASRPPLASAAAGVPVAWPIDKLAMAAYGYDFSFFPTPDDYAAAYLAYRPPDWGRKGQPVYKPRVAFVPTFGTDTATVAAALAAIAAEIASHGIMVDTRGMMQDAYGFSTFSPASLPPSGWTSSFDSFVVDAAPLDISNPVGQTTPEQWTAGETLFILSMPFGANKASAGYMLATGTDPDETIGMRLADFMSLEVARIVADFPRYAKFGLHLVSTWSVDTLTPGFDEAAHYADMVAHLAELAAALSPVGVTLSPLYQLADDTFDPSPIAATLFAAEVIPKVKEFFGLA